MFFVVFCNNYNRLIDVVLVPHRRHLKHFGFVPGDPLLWWKAGLGVAAASVVGFFVIKAFHNSGSHGGY